MILVVSDVHLGYKHANSDEFKSFVEEKAGSSGIDMFVLLGDILDLWRRDPIYLLLQYRETLDCLRQVAPRVCYVVGNHDYHLLELANLLRRHWGVEVVERISLWDEEVKYHFIHGHQFEYGDVLDMYETFADLMCLSDDDIGREAQRLWRFFTATRTIKGYKNILSTIRFCLARRKIRESLEEPKTRLTDVKLGLIGGEAVELSKREDATIVFGHTHNGFVDKKRRIVNAGCWVSEPGAPSEYETSYLEIVGEKITLHNYGK